MNYTELADRIAEYLRDERCLPRCEELLKDVESALRSIPTPETPSRVCWLAMDWYGDDSRDLYLYESDPQLDGRKFSNEERCFAVDLDVAPNMLPGQKCRVTFGPIIDCNPPPQPEKSLGQAWWEAGTTTAVPWSELCQDTRNMIEKRAAAVVAEHERRKGQ